MTDPIKNAIGRIRLGLDVRRTLSGIRPKPGRDCGFQAIASQTAPVYLDQSQVAFKDKTGYPALLEFLNVDELTTRRSQECLDKCPDGANAV